MERKKMKNERKKKRKFKKNLKFFCCHGNKSIECRSAHRSNKKSIHLIYTPGLREPLDNANTNAGTYIQARKLGLGGHQNEPVAIAPRRTDDNSASWRSV